jgi:hypothetical protein
MCIFMKVIFQLEYFFLLIQIFLNYLSVIILQTERSVNQINMMKNHDTKNKTPKLSPNNCFSF